MSYTVSTISSNLVKRAIPFYGPASTTPRKAYPSRRRNKPPSLLLTSAVPISKIITAHLRGKTNIVFSPNLQVPAQQVRNEGPPYSVPPEVPHQPPNPPPDVEGNPPLEIPLPRPQVQPDIPEVPVPPWPGRSPNGPDFPVPPLTPPNSPPDVPSPPGTPRSPPPEQLPPGWLPPDPDIVPPPSHPPPDGDPPPDIRPPPGPYL